ncbi:ATP-binding protein, partial [Bacillus cereus]|nr:ATP-binding protein [Bacillus cereus]
IIGACQSCQSFTGLGIVVGKSGYGKTHTLKYYARSPKVAYIECDDTMAQRDLVKAIERALGLPVGYGTIWERVNGIREFFNCNPGYLLIIDEADKLVSKYSQKKMEILRAIFDQSDVGMIIAGEPKLEAQIKGYISRFANRVDFYVSLKGLSANEVRSYLQNFNFEENAIQEMIVRATNNKNGCFRLLDRTLNNILRILNMHGSAEGAPLITVDIIAKASNMMML